MNELPAFFQAYANGGSAALNRFLISGVSLAGLGGAVTFVSISALHVPPGGADRQITVTVIWQLPQPPGRLTLRAPGRPRSHIRFTCTCSSGVPQHCLEVHWIPEGSCYVYAPHRRDGSSGLEYAGSGHVPAGTVRAIVPRYRRDRSDL